VARPYAPTGCPRYGIAPVPITNLRVVVLSDNIVRHLVAAGKTWKAYAEDLPSAGDVTLDLDKGATPAGTIRWCI